MIKHPRKLLLLFVACSVLLVLFAVKLSADARNRQFDSRITVSTALQGISEADIKKIQQEVRSAFVSIPEILGISSDKTAHIRIVASGICYATGRTVLLSLDHVKDSSAPVIHEVTHILANHGHNSFFSEGLAVYFQDRFGRNDTFPNFSIPLDELLKLHRNQLISLQDLINDNNIFAQVGTEQRRLAYIQAGSFIRFLVEQYGERKLADLHNSRTLDFGKVYGKKLVDLENEWQNFVFAGLQVKA
ncbi:MAG: hypothetical protein R3297_05175 [Desulfobulbales bacterium]|nr:hypothetical protein [Desulfobulbales bacterium]